MKIEEYARQIIWIKDSIRINENNYQKNKKLYDEAFEFMNVAKHNLKNAQKLHWENKAIREDINFKLYYNSTLELYNMAKTQFNNYCNMLKFNKIIRKDRQRQLSIINRELKNDN